jgi:hypothetical protein
MTTRTYTPRTIVRHRIAGSGHACPGPPFNTGPRAASIRRGNTPVDANEALRKIFERDSLPKTR